MLPSPAALSQRAAPSAQLCCRGPPGDYSAYLPGTDFPSGHPYPWNVPAVPGRAPSGPAVVNRARAGLGPSGFHPHAFARFHRAARSACHWIAIQLIPLPAVIEHAAGSRSVAAGPGQGLADLQRSADQPAVATGADAAGKHILVHVPLASVIEQRRRLQICSCSAGRPALASVSERASAKICICCFHSAAAGMAWPSGIRLLDCAIHNSDMRYMQSFPGRAPPGPAVVNRARAVSALRASILTPSPGSTGLRAPLACNGMALWIAQSICAENPEPLPRARDF